jgi:hypothetical protein
MTKRKHPVEPMHFINVDLEIGSKRTLAPLIAEPLRRVPRCW